MLWETIERFVEMRSPWVTVIGETLRDEHEKIINYWRVQRADSAVIVTVQNGQFVLPKAIYRHGLEEVTLDFPGGRILPKQKAIDAAAQILDKELGLNPLDLVGLKPLNEKGWAINSSFSNQKLFGFVAEVAPDVKIAPEMLHSTAYSTNEQGTNELLRDLTCLQCHALLLEWQHRKALRIC